MKHSLPGPQEPIRLLSIVIPARDEEARVGATVEHLYVELRLHLIEHEIVVVDDGSTDWHLGRPTASSAAGADVAARSEYRRARVWPSGELWLGSRSWRRHGGHDGR